MNDLPEEVIRRELGPHEKPLWVGQPQQGTIFRWWDLLLIPFSLCWFGFVLLWVAMAATSEGSPWFMPLFSIPFVLAGLFFVFGRFWYDSWTRATTYYGVTCERVLIVTGIFQRQVRSLLLETVADVSMTERGNGAGTITFGAMNPLQAMYGEGPWQGFGMFSGSTFELSHDSRKVYEIVRDAIHLARRPRLQD